MIALQILPLNRECTIGLVPVDRTLVGVVLLMSWGAGPESIDQHLHRLSSVAFRGKGGAATPKKMAWWTWATQKIAACSKDPNI